MCAEIGDLDAISSFSFSPRSRYLFLESTHGELFPMAENPMRTEHETSGPGEAAGVREAAALRPRDESADQVGGESVDSRADVPAELTVHAHPADAEEATLSDEDIAAFRRRVADGFYNSRDVADEVARRMLRSGDI
jgi:hypothetical protein